MQAAQSAAQADGLLPPSSSNSGGNNENTASLQQQQQQQAVALAQATQARLAVQNARALQLQQQQQQQQQQAALAAQVAASANNTVSAAGGGGGGGNNKKKGAPLRRGKWTPEEEAYANRLIQEFKAGLLPLTDGTTLRTFLSKLLNCDPMRISKKFVGSNCIGKQVFRRRTADLNRLTPEQIAQSRAELSEYVILILMLCVCCCCCCGCLQEKEACLTFYCFSLFLSFNRLERRFLERVAQTNRVKSSGVGGGGGASSGNAAAAAAGNNMMSGGGIIGKNELDNLARQHQQQHQLQQQLQQQQLQLQQQREPPSPPWLQPPAGYKHGEGASLAAANSRAAAAGRALLSGLGGGGGGSSSHQNQNTGFGTGNASSELLAALQRRASQQSMLNALQRQGQSSAGNLLAAAAVRSGSNNAFGGDNSSLSLSQLAQNVSASRLAGNSSSVNELMLKTGLSRDQLSHLARERGGLSSGSLSNMIQRQSSFDALMSLDFQSIQSIDNLANLIQSGGGGVNVPETGIQNADFETNQGGGRSTLNEGLSQVARRLTSQGRMESLLRNLSSHNVRDSGGGGIGSNANLSNLLQSMQNMQNYGGGNASHAANASAASLFGGNQSAMSLADLLRQDSSTGLTALRMQDGLTQRNSSVDDFLSLVAAGDIPHQDPSLLNIPLMQQQQQQQGGGGGGGDSSAATAAKFLSQQHLLQQSNPALANALASRSFGNLAGGSDGGGSSTTQGLSSNMLQQFAAQQQQQQQHQMGSPDNSKRKLDDMSGSLPDQGDAKR